MGIWKSLLLPSACLFTGLTPSNIDLAWLNFIHESFISYRSSSIFSSAQFDDYYDVFHSISLFHSQFMMRNLKSEHRLLSQKSSYLWHYRHLYFTLWTNTISTVYRTLRKWQFSMDTQNRAFVSFYFVVIFESEDIVRVWWPLTNRKLV